MENQKKTTKKRGTRKKATTKKTAAKKTAAKKPAKKKKGFDEKAFLKKYPHVVAGSVKEAKVGSTVGGLEVVHPRICQIKCKETGKLRTIHTQDAWQTHYTKEVQDKKARERAAERRRKKKAAAKKAS